MKKIKLIAPILGAAATLGTAIPLASCQKEAKTILITTELNMEEGQELVTPTYEITQGEFGQNYEAIVHLNPKAGGEAFYAYNYDVVLDSGIESKRIPENTKGAQQDGYVISDVTAYSFKISIPAINFQQIKIDSRLMAINVLLSFNVRSDEADGTIETWTKNNELAANLFGDTTGTYNGYWSGTNAIYPQENNLWRFTINSTDISAFTDQDIRFSIFGVQNADPININTGRIVAYCGANDQDRIQIQQVTGGRGCVWLKKPAGGWPQANLIVYYEFINSYPTDGVQVLFGQKNA